jgi:hypothetical protein
MSTPTGPPEWVATATVSLFIKPAAQLVIIPPPTPAAAVGVGVQALMDSEVVTVAEAAAVVPTMIMGPTAQPPMIL